jgi:hypothetical protein
LLFALLAALASGSALADSAPEPLLVAPGFTTPAVVVPRDALSPRVASERAWTRVDGDITLRLIEVRLHGPCTLAQYVARWRGSHACTAKPVKTMATLASILAPSSTLAGACEGGERYIMQVVKLAHGFVELHADSPIGGGGAVALEAALRGLLLTAHAPTKPLAQPPDAKAEGAPVAGAVKPDERAKPTSE